MNVYRPPPDSDNRRSSTYTGPVALHYQNLGMKLRNVAEAMNLEEPEVKTAEVDQITSRLPVGASKPASIIEIGCGYGRLVGEFSGRGMSYTGVDINASYVEACRTQFGGAGRFYVADFLKEGGPLGERFDIVAFPWLLLTHYSFQQQRRMLTQARELLRENTVSYIVFDHIPTHEVGMGRYTAEEWVEGDVLKPLVGESESELGCYIMNDAFARAVAHDNGLNLQVSTMQLKKVSKQYFFLVSGE